MISVPHREVNTPNRLDTLMLQAPKLEQTTTQRNAIDSCNNPQAQPSQGVSLPFPGRAKVKTAVSSGTDLPGQQL